MLINKALELPVINCILFFYIYIVIDTYLLNYLFLFFIISISHFFPPLFSIFLILLFLILYFFFSLLFLFFILLILYSSYSPISPPPPLLHQFTLSLHFYPHIHIFLPLYSLSTHASIIFQSIHQPISQLLSLSSLLFNNNNSDIHNKIHLTLPGLVIHLHTSIGNCLYLGTLWVFTELKLLPV